LAVPFFVNVGKLKFTELLNLRTFLVSSRKVPQRSRLKEALRANAPSLRIHPPHRHPAFKNVPIFERLLSANLQVCSAEPAENRNIFSGRWSNAAGVGSGARWCSAQRIRIIRLPVASAQKFMRFARNASPRTTSLVTFLFGHKKVTSAVGSINSNLTHAERNPRKISSGGYVFAHFSGNKRC